MLGSESLLAMPPFCPSGASVIATARPLWMSFGAAVTSPPEPSTTHADGSFVPVQSGGESPMPAALALVAVTASADMPRAKAVRLRRAVNTANLAFHLRQTQLSISRRPVRLGAATGIHTRRNPMKYMLMIYTGTSMDEWEKRPEEERNAISQEYFAINEHPGVIGGDQSSRARRPPPCAWTTVAPSRPTAHLRRRRRSS